MLKRVILISVVILSLLGAVAYYFVFFELNRTKEAVIGLYLKNDNFVKNQFDYALYESALEARFKEWTNYQDLVRYVESLAGECTPSGTGDSVCRFYMSERFCYVIWISVKVKVDNGKIRQISTEKEEDGC